MRELDVLKLVSARLECAGIEYMLTGSLAMNYYAQPRMTRDIDLVVALGANDAGRVMTLFEGDFYVEANSVRDAVVSGGMFNLLHLESVVKVDVIAPSKARRILRGGSPRRVRVSHPPVSSVDLIEERVTANDR